MLKHKTFTTIALLYAIFIVCGCSKNSGASTLDNYAVPVELQDSDAILSHSSSAQDAHQDYNADVTIQPIDVDLSCMSNTMAYAEITHIIEDPTDYFGKVIKMHGICSIYTDPDTQKQYYNCVIPDAPGCCTQGLEFVLANQNTPTLYDGQDIIVTGILSSYQEGELHYLFLQNAQLTSL